jgi:hypothetical protein
LLSYVKITWLGFLKIVSTGVALIVIILRYFFLADGRSHHVFFLRWQRLLGSYSRKRTVAGSLFFAIDVVFTEVGILRVDHVRAA